MFFFTWIYFRCNWFLETLCYDLGNIFFSLDSKIDITLSILESLDCECTSFGWATFFWYFDFVTAREYIYCVYTLLFFLKWNHFVFDCLSFLEIKEWKLTHFDFLLILWHESSLDHQKLTGCLKLEEHVFVWLLLLFIDDVKI